MANLIIEKVTHSFSGIKILDCDYTEISSNKVTGLIGRNGEGKSTLFKILYGNLKADYSRLFFDNKLITKSYYIKNLIAYLPQDDLIPASIKIKDFIKLTTLKKRYKESISIRFNHSLNKYVSSLSKGQRRLLEILYILYSDKEFILLDEPYNGLAPKQINEVNEIIKNSRKSVIISSHLFQDMHKVTDEILLMNSGNLQKIQNIDDLKQLNYLPKSP